MDSILKSPFRGIPTNPFARELTRIDLIKHQKIVPEIHPLLPILKAILRQTAPKEQSEKPDPEPKPASDSPYMDFNEACTYLRLTERQLKDLCRGQNITHARIDYRTYRFKKSDLDEWFEAYKMYRKSVYD